VQILLWSFHPIRAAILPSEIFPLSSCEFVGMVADEPTEKLEPSLSIAKY